MSMVLHVTSSARRAVLLMVAVLALSPSAAPTALADGMAAMPGMSAEEHAHMSDSASGHDHGSMPGMSAAEHTRMSGSGKDRPDDGSMPGMDMRGHEKAAADTRRPVALALGGFAVVNALVLACAAVIRRRPDARKRRRTLSRVRSTPPKPTVFAPSTPENQS
jgi:uncharacterized protein involved in copper resistance